MKTEMGNRTVVAELKSSITHVSRHPLMCLLAGPANASIELRPGWNKPEEIQMVGLISDWMVTPEQYEDHIRRSSRRQFIEDEKYDSSQSGSRSFTSAERWQVW